MWSPRSEEKQHHHHKGLNKNLATHSSKSSSSSFTSSSYNHPKQINKTMEEVWKDINLSSLNDHTCSRDHIDPQNTTTTTRTTNFGGMILQDLLARPFANDPPTAATAACVSLVPPPPPVTMLTLNSGPELHFFSSLNPLRQRLISQQKTIYNRSSFDALASQVGGHANGRKRYPESETNCGDHKNKRMIKNRESAARSRARKQAYTNELELEVAHLMKENARLKRQQEQLCFASAGAQLPKKNSLYRTATAPF